MLRFGWVLCFGYSVLGFGINALWRVVLGGCVVVWVICWCLRPWGWWFGCWCGMVIELCVGFAGWCELRGLCLMVGVGGF